MPHRFRFVHRLTAEAAYGALLRSNRRLLHSAVADALAERHTPGTGAERELLVQLAEHLGGAGRWAQAHARWCALLEVSAAAGHFAAWEAWVAEAAYAWEQAQPGQLPAADHSALLLSALAARCLTQGDLPQAEEFGARALALATTGSDFPTMARAHLLLAVVLRAWGRIDEASVQYAAALRSAQQAGLRSLQADVLTGQAALHSETSDFEAAEQCVSRALALREAQHDLRGLASTLMTQSTILRLKGGNFETALSLRRQALELARAAGNRLLEGWLLGNIANMLSQSGELAAAEQHALQALELLREAGDRSTEALFNNNLGSIYGRLGRVAEERACYERALAAQRELGELRAAATALTNLGMLALGAGNPAGALPFLDEAIAFSSEVGDQLSLATALCYKIDAALALGQPGEAQELYKQAAAALVDCGDAPEQALVVLRQAYIRQALGDQGGARASAEQADVLRRRSGLPDGSAEAQTIRELIAQLTS